MNDSLTLLGRFVRSPARTASVSTSSAKLVARMIAPWPRTDDPVVVELGPGTGAVTDEIRERLGGRGRQLAVEIDPVLAGRLARRHAGVEVVPADAAALPRLLAERGVPAVDLVVSLLPWAAHRAAPIPRLVADALAPGGAFTQVVLAPLRFLGPARRLDRDTRRAFAAVHLTPTVWRNVPPARVRIARRPRPI